MEYKIKSSLLPVKCSILDGTLLQEPIHETLAMYDREEDISDSPFIQSGQWRYHESSNGTIESARRRQDELIKLYESIKRNGYDGSVIQVWFDEEGHVHVYDGFHRIIIMNYLGLDEPVNVTTDWVEPPGKIRFVGTDFPLQKTLVNEPPRGEWLYQPVDDPRVRDWSVARPDSESRLEYILKNLVGKTVLDVGCAEGYFSRNIAKYGYSVTGIDVSYGLVSTARYLSVLDGVKVEYLVGDWANILKRLGHFDNILCLSVLHNEMKQLGVEQVLEKMKLLRTKTANLFLEVPNNSNEKQWMVAGFPNFDFHASMNSIAGGLGMKTAGSFQGMRTIYQLNSSNLVLEPDVNGYPMYLFKDELYITHMAKTGIFEPKTVEFIKQNLKPGQVFVDVGANVGFFTILTSKLVGDRGKVYAFEPSSECFDVLKKNVELNKCSNVQLFEIGLSNKSGRSRLYKPNPISYGQQYLEDVIAPKDKLDYEQYDVKELLSSDKFEEIDVKRLDEVLKQPPDMVKVDVEGAERLVLEGMGKLLGQTQTVIVEDLDQTVHPWLIKEHGFYPTSINYERRNCVLQRHKPILKIPAKPRLHILGIPYTKTRKDYCMDPFTQLTYNMCRMMKNLGYEVYHYGTEGSNVSCTEHVNVVSDDLQRQLYGGQDTLHNYWNFKRDDLVFKTFAENAISQINTRKQPYDMLLTINGRTDKPIADATGLMAVEYAVGYEGVFSQYKVFASYAWMHYIYGKMNVQDGNWYDAVIPHYFDPEDFEFREKKGDYFVYFGRLVPRKGPHIAAQVCEKIGAKLIVSGQGDLKACGLDKPFVERVDCGTIKSRSDLLGGAKAVFTPTMYIEPFGMVTVEALMCGTPLISTDWGSFPEIVKHGVVGYRCRTFAEFVEAAENTDKIKPADCRKWAVDNFSLDVVAGQYDRYFKKLLELYGDGWYTLNR